MPPEEGTVKFEETGKDGNIQNTGKNGSLFSVK
jgi:hypothetical protein